MAGMEVLAASGYSHFPLTESASGSYGEYSGNYLARELRRICEDTRGLFPKSAKSSRSYYAKNGKPLRFLSSYETDINGRYWGQEDKYRTLPKEVLEAAKQAEIYPDVGKHTHGVNKATLKEPLPKMFMNWKIPERIISEDGSDLSSVRGRKQGSSRQADYLPKIPDIHDKPSSPRKASKLVTAQKSVTPRLPAPVGRAASDPNDHGEVIKRTLGDPELQKKTLKMLENASPTERRTIEKALFAAERAARQGYGTPNRTYRPDTRQQVNKWLDDASDEERRLALEFFQSVSGSRMMGGEKKQRLKNLLQQLETGNAYGVSLSYNGLPKQHTKSGLKNIQLYHPKERRNHWMYKTWHHMPDYKDMDPVNNRSSIYVDSQRPIPRHFTIHPDWGP